MCTSWWAFPAIRPWHAFGDGDDDGWCVKLEMTPNRDLVISTCIGISCVRMFALNDDEEVEVDVPMHASMMMMLVALVQQKIQRRKKPWPSSQWHFLFKKRELSRRNLLRLEWNFSRLWFIITTKLMLTPSPQFRMAPAMNTFNKKLVGYIMTRLSTNSHQIHNNELFSWCALRI